MAYGAPEPLIFVGGLHGAGKTTICRSVAGLLVVEHVTAGALIRASAGSSDAALAGVGGKAVLDVNANQEHLLKGLASHRAQRRSTPSGMLMDGHFCLLESSSVIAKVPFVVFEALHPVALLLVEADVETVRRRLVLRDGAAVSLEILDALAAQEHAHAIAVASRLQVPLYHARGDVDTESAAPFVASQVLPHLTQELA